jgi:hypothetical protein
MLVRELFEAGSTMAWTRKGNKNIRKFRCTSGPRKGRVMASPASCNKPIDIHKSKQLKVTKSQKSSHIKTRGKITRRSNVGSVRLAKLNRPRKRTPSSKGRKIR